MVACDRDPDEGPEDGRNAFDDEGPLPADGMDQVAGRSGHPGDGDGIAQDENGVGLRTLLFGEPVGQQDEHRRHDEALSDAEHGAVEDQQIVVANDPGECREDAPTDEREEDQAGCAAANGVGCRRNLEEKIAEKEDRAEEGCARFGDVERLGQPCCRAEAEVGAPKVGETVRDKNDRHQVQPAPAQIRRMRDFIFQGLDWHTSFISFPVDGRSTTT